MGKIVATEKKKLEESITRLSEFCKVLEEYLEFALKPDRIYKALLITKSAIETGKTVLIDAGVAKNSIQQFFHKIRKQEKIIANNGKRQQVCTSLANNNQNKPSTT